MLDLLRSSLFVLTLGNVLYFFTVFQRIILKRRHTHEYDTNMKWTCQWFYLIYALIKKPVRCYSWFKQNLKIHTFVCSEGMLKWSYKYVQKLVYPQNNHQLHSTEHNCLTFLWTKLICMIISFLHFTDL